MFRIGKTGCKSFDPALTNVRYNASVDDPGPHFNKIAFGITSPRKWAFGKCGFLL